MNPRSVCSRAAAAHPFMHTTQDALATAPQRRGVRGRGEQHGARDAAGSMASCGAVLSGVLRARALRPL